MGKIATRNLRENDFKKRPESKPRPKIVTTSTTGKGGAASKSLKKIITTKDLSNEQIDKVGDQNNERPETETE